MGFVGILEIQGSMIVTHLSHWIHKNHETHEPFKNYLMAKIYEKKLQNEKRVANRQTENIKCPNQRVATQITNQID